MCAKFSLYSLSSYLHPATLRWPRCHTYKTIIPLALLEELCPTFERKFCTYVQMSFNIHNHPIHTPLPTGDTTFPHMISPWLYHCWMNFAQNLHTYFECRWYLKVVLTIALLTTQFPLVTSTSPNINPPNHNYFWTSFSQICCAWILQSYNCFSIFLSLLQPH